MLQLGGRSPIISRTVNLPFFFQNRANEEDLSRRKYCPHCVQIHIWSLCDGRSLRRGPTAWPNQTPNLVSLCRWLLNKLFHEGDIRWGGKTVTLTQKSLLWQMKALDYHYFTIYICYITEAWFNSGSQGKNGHCCIARL